MSDRNSFKESFLDRNNKMDHKRLTVFVFTCVFLGTSLVALFTPNEIVNADLLETIIYIQGSVILGGMGFSMINKPTNKPTENATQQELHTGGNDPQSNGSEMGLP